MRSIGILGLKNSPKISLWAIGINLSKLYPKSQPAILEKEKIEENIGYLIDKINHKYGDWTIYPAVLGLIHKDLN